MARAEEGAGVEMPLSQMVVGSKNATHIHSPTAQVPCSIAQVPWRTPSFFSMDGGGGSTSSSNMVFNQPGLACTRHRELIFFTSVVSRLVVESQLVVETCLERKQQGRYKSCGQIKQ